MKDDINDTLLSKGADAVRDRHDKAKRYSPDAGASTSANDDSQPQKPNGAWRQKVLNVTTLQTMTFPPMRYVLPGYVPEGATLLVSRPKLGKSWLVLDLAIAVAAGRFTLGEIKPAQGNVLYLALEDGKRRLQRRMTKLLPTFSGTWPDRMEVATEWRRADQGGLDDLEQWIRSVPDPRLIIIDTLAQFRSPSNGKTPPYENDYAAIAGLQKLASKRNIAIVIVHHDRKAEADDVFDTVSGTLGLSAAADTILIMKRQSSAVTLYVRGRDVEESETALQFNKESCKWTILGAAAEVYLSTERQRILEALAEAGEEGLKAADIKREAQLRSLDATHQTLTRMFKAKQVDKVRTGVYRLPSNEDRETNCQPPCQPCRSVSVGTNRADLTEQFSLTDTLTGLTPPSDIPDGAAEPVTPDKSRSHSQRNGGPKGCP
jgi:hypothetical protein